MKKQLGPFEYALCLCVLLVGLFQLSSFIWDISVKLSNKPYNEIYNRLMVTEIIIEIISYIFVINVALKDLRKPLAEVCYFKKVDGGAWIAIIPCAIGINLFCCCYSVLIYFLGAKLVDYRYSEMNFYVYLVQQAIIPGVAEELFMKGLVFTILKRRYSTISSVIIASLMFAGMHLNLNYFIFFFIFSCYTFWIYLRSGNLALSMLLHFINNLRNYFPLISNNILIIFCMTLGAIGLGLYLFSKLDKPELENITKQVNTRVRDRVSITKEINIGKYLYR